MKDRVFVIHGRNEAARRGLFAFLRSLGLKPIEFSAAISQMQHGSPSVPDIIESGLQNADAAVVLLVGEEEVRLLEPFQQFEEEDEFELQARPNVLFEAGMALAMFRASTVFVRMGHHRDVSDISGIHWVQCSDDDQKFRNQLAERLSSAGLDVDRSGTDWHDAGRDRILEALELIDEAQADYH